MRVCWPAGVSSECSPHACAPVTESGSPQDGQVSVEEFKCAIKDTCLNKEYDELPDALRAFIGSLFSTVDVNGRTGPGVIHLLCRSEICTQLRLANCGHCVGVFLTCGCAWVSIGDLEMEERLNGAGDLGDGGGVRVDLAIREEPGSVYAGLHISTRAGPVFGAESVGTERGCLNTAPRLTRLLGHLVTRGIRKNVRHHDDTTWVIFRSGQMSGHQGPEVIQGQILSFSTFFVGEHIENKKSNSAVEKYMR